MLCWIVNPMVQREPMQSTFGSLLFLFTKPHFAQTKANFFVLLYADNPALECWHATIYPTIYGFWKCWELYLRLCSHGYYSYKCKTKFKTKLGGSNLTVDTQNHLSHNSNHKSHPNHQHCPSFRRVPAARILFEQALQLLSAELERHQETQLTL